MSYEETNEQNEDARTEEAAGEPEGSAEAAEPAEAAEQAAPTAAPAEPEEQLSPKERRSRERSRHRGEARPPRSVQERAGERAEDRRRKAAARRAWRARRSERSNGAERGPARTEPVRSESRSAPRVRQGVVVSDRADKTITVRIDVTRRHRAYKKIVRESTTLHAHDERNDAGVGDTVRVVESRPLSRSKRWRLVDVLERAR
jgi:small subunit ribosomal protein S17